MSAQGWMDKENVFSLSLSLSRYIYIYTYTYMYVYICVYMTIFKYIMDIWIYV